MQNKHQQREIWWCAFFHCSLDRHPGLDLEKISKNTWSFSIAPQHPKIHRYSLIFHGKLAVRSTFYKARREENNKFNPLNIWKMEHRFQLICCQNTWCVHHTSYYANYWGYLEILFFSWKSLTVLSTRHKFDLSPKVFFLSKKSNVFQAWAKMLFLWEKSEKNDRRPFDLLAQVAIVRPEWMKVRVAGNILKVMSFAE